MIGPGKPRPGVGAQRAVTAIQRVDDLGRVFVGAGDEHEFAAQVEQTPGALIERQLIGVAIIADYPDIPLILDPVLASGRGDELATDQMMRAMRDLLIPQATVLTPNSLEARRLADDDDESDPASLDDCAVRLLEMGCEFVLITGTHENTTQVINTLYGNSGMLRTDTWPRLPGSYHGSGCTLASALAATLANGLDIEEAVRDAQEYTWQSLRCAFRPGMGQHIPDRLFWAREEEVAIDVED